MPTKKKWNPTRVLAHVDSVLAANASLQMRLTAAERLVATNADAVNHWKQKAAEYEKAQIYWQNINDTNVASQYKAIAELREKLKAADEIAGKALADAKRARDESRKSEIYVLQREMVGGGLHFMPFVDREAALKQIKASWNTEGGRYTIKERNPNCWDVIDGQGNFMYRYQGSYVSVRAF